MSAQKNGVLDGRWAFLGAQKLSNCRHLRHPSIPTSSRQAKIFEPQVNTELLANHSGWPEFTTKFSLSNSPFLAR
jgi:hypothetical protein